MPLDKAAREQALKTIDAFFQLGVDQYTWYNKNPAYTGYIPVCAYIVLQPDTQGLHRAKAIADMKATTAAGVNKTFAEFLVSTGLASSWPDKARALEAMGEEGILSLADVAFQAGCHGSFSTDLNKLYGRSRWFKLEGEKAIVASCADYEPGQNQRQTYLDFLLGAKSPWKSLLDCGYSCHYYKDGRLAGVSFVVEDIPEDLRWSVKNFFVALRQAREKPAFADIFHEAVKAGADPRVAMLACGEVTKVGDTSTYTVHEQTYHNGGHWPLSIEGDKGFDPARFFSGDMNIPLMKKGSVSPYDSRTIYHTVNAPFGCAEVKDRPVTGVSWITALKAGGEGGQPSMYSNRRLTKYRSLKTLCDVAQAFLIEKGAKL